MPAKKNTFKILSLDGGGIRGIIPALILAEIEKRTKKRISELFDLIAGTSTGGILALGMVKPAGKTKAKKDVPAYSAEEAVALYEAQGSRIFARSPWRVVRSVGGFIDEKYPTEGVESVLQEFFGTSMLSEALTDTIIPSYEIETRSPFFFKSKKARDNADEDYMMWQAARATSAAPSYFEPVQIMAKGKIISLVDGGLVANTPAMCAYAELLRWHPGETNIMVVSLGTGEATRPIPYAEARAWGLAEWLLPVFSMFFDGMQDSVDYQLRQICGSEDSNLNRYYRFQPTLVAGNDNIDDASRTNLRVLRLVTEDLIKKQSAAIDLMCQHLLA
jgi:patatin-like phospholipase/acyl hydrolase